MNKEATTEKFFTQRDQSVIHQRQSALHAKDQVTRVSKIARISKDQFEKQKEEIEGQLFELFKEKPAWKTADVAVCAVVTELCMNGAKVLQNVLQALTACRKLFG